MNELQSNQKLELNDVRTVCCLPAIFELGIFVFQILLSVAKYFFIKTMFLRGYLIYIHF